MDGLFILIAGSADLACPDERVKTAIELVRCFTREVLNRGGGVVVLGSEEGPAKGKRGTPRIFDWVVLREVERYASSTTEVPRQYAIVVMSDDAEATKIDTTNLQLLNDLEQRNVVELSYIRRRSLPVVNTGGCKLERLTPC